MSLGPETFSRISSVRRCDQDNIQELTGILRSVNDRVRALSNKILVNGTRLEQKEAKELQQLLRMQAKLILIQVDPGSGSVEKSLFNNECHRVTQIRETFREIERRHQLRILNDY